MSLLSFYPTPLRLICNRKSFPLQYDTTQEGLDYYLSGKGFFPKEKDFLYIIYIIIFYYPLNNFAGKPS